MCQAVEEESERLFAEMADCMQNIQAELKVQVRILEKDKLRSVKRMQTLVASEMDEMKKRDAQIELLSLTNNDVHFLQVTRPSVTLSCRAHSDPDVLVQTQAGQRASGTNM